MLERIKYNSATGQKESEPFVQKFGVKEFNTFMKRSLEAQGYTVTILHDPENTTKAEGEPVKSAEPSTENK